MTKIDVSDLLLDPPKKTKIKINYKKVSLYSILIILIISSLKINSLRKEETIKSNEKEVLLKVEKIIISKETRYIQLAAYKNNKKGNILINKLNKEKMKFIEKKGMKYTRLLIGPFNNYIEAKKEIEEIRRKYKKDAFITSKF